MTTEEKAKAYDEALEKAKSHINSKGIGDTVDLCRHLFPQLSESEKERMMRVIGLALTDVPEERFTSLGTTLKDCLAYLEKQKEQKPAENHDLVAKLKEHLANTPKEQLEAEWKELEKWNHVGPTVEEYLRGIKPAEWSEDIIRKAIKEVGLTQHQIDWFKTNVFPPKQEWSDEDERYLILLCRIIHSRVVNKELSLAEESKLGKWIDKWINHEPQPVQKWDEFDEDCLKRAIWYVKNPAPSVVKDTNLVLWLECLPERFNLQPKQEWSEEDKANLNNIIWLCENCEKGIENVWIPSQATQIKNLIKSLRPQPHWKPSNEQMWALAYALADMPEYYTSKCTLETLEKELKKLM